MRLKTIIAFCLLSMAVLAQKTPKSRLISYSHISVNPEIPVDNDFDLRWINGKGTLTIKKTDTYPYIDEVDESLFHQVADIIKAKKLYTIRKKKLKKKDLKMMPANDPGVEEYTLNYNGKYISCTIGDLSKEQIKGFDELEAFIKEAVNYVKPPRGRLIECSLSNESTLPGRGGTFECLTVKKGLAPELVLGRSTSPIISEEDNRYIVSNEDIQNLQELILKEKLYKMTLFDEDLHGDAPIHRIFLKYDNDKVYSARYQQHASKDVAKAESLLSDFFNSLTKKYKPAPKGKLLSYSHTSVNPEIPIDNDFSLSRIDGKATLTVKQSSNLCTSEYIGEASEDLFNSIADTIKAKQLYTVVKKQEDPEPMPYAYPGRDRYSIHFEDEWVSLDHMDLTTEQQKAFEELETYIKKQSKEVQLTVGYPKGKMTYCSCEYTNSGLPVGHIHDSYYELIAEEGKAPKVIYYEDRGNAEKRTEYRATQKDVTELSKILRDLKIFRINGYHVDEKMMGGTSYRVHMEFASGEKLHASWFTSHPDALALKAYDTILQYLQKITER